MRNDLNAATDNGPASVQEAGRHDVLADVERLIAALEAHHDPEVGDKVRDLLAGIDAVHRTALTHLVAAIQSLAGEAFLNRLVADPAIRILLMSYDLLAVDRRIMAEEALDLVRGHLHGHGIDIELVDVVGGVVHVRLHGSHEAADREGIRRDLERALREGLLGFQELEFRERETADKDSFVPASLLRRANKPVYHDALRLDELPVGQMRSVVVGAEPVLIAHVDGEILAVKNRCGQSPLPLEYGTLEGAELRCSWHGCRYDLRTGQRVDRADAGPDERLAVFPVTVRNGTISIAIGVTPAVSA